MSALRSELLVDTRHTPLHEYAAWSVLAIAYAIAFAQRVSPQTVNLRLVDDLGTNAAGIAVLASGYFWGYALMQIPAGLLVDRYGVRRIVLLSMTLSVIGSAAFATSQGIISAFGARSILAVGDALVFTSLLKLVAERFPDGRFGLMSGLSQVSGYLGGALATVPLASGIDHFGWRTCFIFVAMLGAANLLASLAALPNVPLRQSGKSFEDLWVAVKQALSRWPNWGCALTFASHFAAVTTLSGVWGIPLVAHSLNINLATAGFPLLVFMVGNAVGSIVLGHLSDRVHSLPRALILICFVRMILIVLLLPSVIRHLGLTHAVIDFALLGLVAGGTVPLVLKCTKRLYTTALIGTGASVNTTVANIIAALAQPLIGVVMVGAAGVRMGTPNTEGYLGDPPYTAMIIVLLAVSTLGIVGPLLMQRTMRPQP